VCEGDCDGRPTTHRCPKNHNKETTLGYILRVTPRDTETNVTGHAGDINEITRAAINCFGGQIHYDNSHGFLDTQMNRDPRDLRATLN
jgi:hypothetical protein